MNTIGDMQNEKNYLNHYNEFEYNHDFVIFLWLNLKPFPRVSDNFLFKCEIIELVSIYIKWV